MQQSTETEKLVSLEEYIHLDETGIHRHEFYYGKLFAMPGETLLHNEICSQILFLLKVRLNSKFKIYIESVKVKIENEDIYLYPDIVVTLPQTSLAGLKNYIIHQPILIAEILSDSTRKYDSTDKFIQYQKVSTLRYYLLVEPEKHVVIFYEKEESGAWNAKTFTDMDELIHLPFFPAQLTLGEIYY